MSGNHKVHVRKRTYISDEKCKILHEYYKRNPLPNREVLDRIAKRLDFPVRVVQVWFRNTRGRAQCGKMSTVPFTCPQIALQPLRSEPLDLTTKNGPLTVQQVALANGSRFAKILPKPANRLVVPTINSSIELPKLGVSSTMRLPIPVVSSTTRLPLNEVNVPMGLPKAGMRYIMGLPVNDESDPLGLPEASKLSVELQMDQSSPSEATGNGTEKGQFLCDECSKTFFYKSTLVRHKDAHLGKRPFECLECSAAFKYRHHLMEHERIHTGEKPYQCFLCRKKFAHSGTYSRHMSHCFPDCKLNS